MSHPQIQGFYQEETGTLTYVVADPATHKAIVIDPAADFVPESGKLSFHHADQVLAYLAEQKLTLEWILETHAHADHITAAQHLKTKTGAKVGTGKGIRWVQKTFKRVYQLGDDFKVDGSQFDQLFDDGDTLKVGELTVNVMATPGHTNDCSTYVIGNHAFIGDTLFMPDSGSARCDFPGGDAALLYDSIQRIFALGDDTLLWMCHDYLPNGRALRMSCTVAEQKAHNIHVGNQRSKADFKAMREARDSNLAIPRLLYPSIQLNIRAGLLPPAEGDGQFFLKLPLSLSH